MMRSQRRLVVLVAACASVSALVPSLPTVGLRQAAGPSGLVVVKMSEESTSMVAVNEENIKSAATASTAAAGLIVGGPVLAIIAAMAGNYVAQQETEVGEVARGVGKVTLDVINFLLKVNTKYDVTGKAGAAASDAVASLKEKDAEGTISKVEGVLGEASVKVKELTSEYDLVEKGKQALSYASDLSNKAIDKGIELNKEYKLTDKVTDSVKTAVDKGVQAAKSG
mmetsp:Transcript_5936/g.15438  ORF Transcript_5936/g.15438 Transcript_5936/m.15438 type:complete len:225 (-) Transcript_5936:319-993(-)